MVTFTAKLTVKAGSESQFEETMKKVVPEVRKEQGNRAYTFCKSKSDPRVFMFFEEYVDDAAVAAQLGSLIAPRNGAGYDRTRAHRSALRRSGKTMRLTVIFAFTRQSFRKTLAPAYHREWRPG